MNADEQYAAAVESCEMAARRHGHDLGVWYLVDERLHASLCEVCGAMALVVRCSSKAAWRKKRIEDRRWKLSKGATPFLR